MDPDPRGKTSAWGILKSEETRGRGYYRSEKRKISKSNNKKNKCKGRGRNFIRRTFKEQTFVKRGNGDKREGQKGGRRKYRKIVVSVRKQ